MWDGCEMGVGAQVMRVVDYAYIVLNNFESLCITLWCNPVFDHIRACFPHIFDQSQSLHKFLSQPQCALSIATFIGKVLEHWESLLTFTFITWNVKKENPKKKCNIFGLISHLTFEDDNRIYLSIYLSIYQYTISMHKIIWNQLYTISLFWGHVKYAFYSLA